MTPTFEQSYRHYPFAELVSLGLTAAKAVVRLRQAGSPAAASLADSEIAQAAH